MAKKKVDVGVQGLAIHDVAYQLGLQCPVGQEPILLIGLKNLWPDLPVSEARESFLKGLADRFDEKNNSSNFVNSV